MIILNLSGANRTLTMTVGPPSRRVSLDGWLFVLHAAAGIVRKEAGSLERDARNLENVLDRRRYLLLVLLTVVYAFGAAMHARSTPFWYDEVITMFAAGAPDAATTYRAAQQTDASPPLPHLLMHFSMKWWGQDEIGARIPAMVGFWIFCLCLYRFTRRRAGIYYALAALLLPITTDAYTYSVWARAYGPELAFSGLALIAWQAAADGSRRIVALPALAASLVGATLCHYYAILLWAPLAGGEAFRWYRTRKIDWGIWAALAAGLSALVWRAATIVGVGKGTTHTWAPPYPGQVSEFWETGLQHSLPFLALLLALVALSIVITRDEPDAGPHPAVAVQDHELIAGALFLAIPVIAVAGAMLLTHMFTPRYVVFALAGIAFLVPMVAAHLLEGRTLFGFLLAAIMLASLGFVTIDIPAPRNPFIEEPILRKALETEPVVISDGQLFLQMWQYAPEPLKSRLLFLADADAAIQYMGFDTIDTGILALRPWAPVKVVEYRNFFAPGREFLVYRNLLRPEWLLAKVMKDGGSARVEEFNNRRELLRVRFKP
jgi:hypothetical protein